MQSSMREEINSFLAELGDFSLDDEGVCSLLIDEQVDLTINTSDEKSSFVIYSTIAAVGSDDKVFRTAMMANAELIELPGYKLAFFDRIGRILLTFSSDESIVEARELALLLSHFSQLHKSISEKMLREEKRSALRSNDESHFLRV